MNTNDHLMNTVIDFVQRVTKTPAGIAGILNAETELGRDLGLDGMDAYEFLGAFGQEFNVDMSSFGFDKHFGPEGIDLTWLHRKLLNKKGPKYVPITIGDLVKAVAAKNWPEQ